VRESIRLFIIRQLWYPRYYFYKLCGFFLYVGINPNISRKSIFGFFNGGSILIGSNCVIDHYALISTHGGNIKIGDNFSLGPFSVIYGAGGLLIGNDVLIGAHTIIIPANHSFTRIDIPIDLQGSTMKGVIIMDDVWIGAGCKILDGVTIGKGSVIGAGSVVNKSILEYSIAVGNPVQIIKSRR
jgi:acetyltransferase-like isoleucine patch superfamily enzyme